MKPCFRRYGWVVCLSLSISIIFHADGLSNNIGTTGTTSPTSSNTNQQISLRELLSTCVDACQRGCHEIRCVQQARQDGFGLEVEWKDARDPKSALTEADARAQQAIVTSLSNEWGPALTIVGEEDDEEDKDDDNNHKDDKTTGSTRGDEAFLRRDLVKFSVDNNNVHNDNDDDDDVHVNLQDVAIFVDPVDGTREFVEGRLKNCQALVGIAVRGQAMAGAIGIPFPSGDLSAETTVVYGQVGVGYGVVGTPLEPNHENSNSLLRPILASGDATIDVMVTARRIIENELGGSNALYGGAGNKVLATALGYADCTIQHRFGGAWDTCAPEAILRAMGGHMTDMAGEELQIHQPNAAKEGLVRLGFVATGQKSVISHKELLANLHANDIVQAYIAKGKDRVNQ